MLLYFIRVIHTSSLVHVGAGSSTAPQHTGCLPCWLAPLWADSQKLSVVWRTSSSIPGCREVVRSARLRNLHALTFVLSQTVFSLGAVGFPVELPRCAPPGRIALGTLGVCCREDSRGISPEKLVTVPLAGGVLPFLSLSELGQGEPSMGSFFLAGGNESALCCFFLWLCSTREHRRGALCREAQPLCVPVSPMSRA